MSRNYGLNFIPTAMIYDLGQIKEKLKFPKGNNSFSN